MNQNVWIYNYFNVKNTSRLTSSYHICKCIYAYSALPRVQLIHRFTIMSVTPVHVHVGAMAWPL